MIDSLKKIYSLFPRKDRFKLLLLFILMGVASLLEVLGIGIIPIFVVAVADPDKILGFPVVGSWLSARGIITAESLVVYGAILLILVYIVKNGYIAFFYYLKKKFIANRGVQLQERIFKAYMTAPYTFYVARNSAELLRNVTGEVKRIVDNTMLPFMELALNVVMFVFILITLVALEPLITAVNILLLGGGGYLFLRVTQRKTRELGKEDRRHRKLKNKVVLQGLGGFKEARVLGREKMFLDAYRTSAIRSKVANVYLYVVKKLPKPIIETLAVITILLITLIMVLEGRTISSIIPVLALFSAAAVRLMPIFTTAITQVSDIRFNAYSVYAIYNDLQILERGKKEEIQDELKRSKVSLKEEITLKGVTYRYPDTASNAVDDVTLTIRKGEVVAFVGASGAGKTTLVDVILGLLEPQNGSVLVDGLDIRENLGGWQENIGYIPQHIYLLDDSIRNNIAFGIPEKSIDEEKLMTAIRAAQLEEFVNSLPDGIETTVGERGTRLSGGQRQRIGIARALYHDPQVLIMDEATSALDNRTEKYVIDAIEELRGDRTIIMIAHRLTTVENCDVIYMMKNGRVIQQGSYSELLDQSEEFRTLSGVI